MAATPALLSSLDTIAYETTLMLDVLDRERATIPSAEDRREVKRRVMELRGKAQELFEWLSTTKLEELEN
jgi:hypothetical protein